MYVIPGFFTLVYTLFLAYLHTKEKKRYKCLYPVIIHLIFFF